ncbi:MAG: beta-ketoacyl synthase chain length factor [Methylococcales bacterium]|nr:beta-ketoacyl synthase chain length factor [Methylococcales bacterium]
MECMSLLGYSACAPDPGLRASLPFPVFDINRDSIPPMLRRRTSQATQIAFSVASAVCVETQRSAAALPAVFASVAGEIQTTDLLCTELVKPEGVISPSAFHNSVQNTAAGYWSIAQQCTQPSSSLAAGCDTFAMALLEAWCQLSCHGGELLLVCYDERWPAYLDTVRGELAFACALVLAAEAVDGAIAHIGRPHFDAEAFSALFESLAARTPVLAVIPLLGLAAAGGAAQNIPVSTVVPGWQARVSPLNTIPAPS